MPKGAATALRTAGYSAVHVVEVGLRAQKDPVIFAYARARGLIIVTRVADFPASHYQPPHAESILLSLPGVPGLPSGFLLYFLIAAIGKRSLHIFCFHMRQCIL
jgi:hypothetical protein